MRRRSAAGVAFAGIVGALAFLGFQGSRTFAAPGATAVRGSASSAAGAVAGDLLLSQPSAAAAAAIKLGAARLPPTGSAAPALGAASLLVGLCAGLQHGVRSEAPTPLVLQRATADGSDVNYLALLFKGDLPKRLLTVIALLGIARVGFYIPLYGFDADATAEYFSRQASSGGIGFIDQLFGGGLGRLSLFSLGIGPYITSSIIFQIFTTVTPQLKALARGEEGEAGRDKYKNYIKYTSFLFALLQGFGQSTQLSPFVFDNGPVWAAQVTLQFAIGAMITLFIADKITEQKLGQGTSLLVFSSIVSNLPRTIGNTLAKADVATNGYTPAALFCGALLLTILALVYVLQAERRIPILFAKRLQDEATGQGGTSDAGDSYLPIKLNASGVLPLIFAGSLLSIPSLIANYTRTPWVQSAAKAVLPGAPAYIPLSVVFIAIFSYVSTFQTLDPKDMSSNLRKQAAAIPQVRPGKETEDYLRGVLERSSVFGAVILAALFVLPNTIELVTQLSTSNSFGGTSLLILVGVAADTWRQLQAELLMQQYATDVDAFYKGRNTNI